MSKDNQSATSLISPSTSVSSPASQANEVLVKVENVGKIFCRDLKKSLLYGLRDGLGDVVPGLGRQYDDSGNPILRKGEFWANQGISFELRRGECLGLIGHNGAGKTTLLKMLNGLIKPDVGRVEMHGRVGALIALGAGFNPILTGRENVYIAGSVLGLSKEEIDEKYDEIVEFAEMPDFMETPVQNYSSGMQVRLGFAVASSMEPDVLLLDEVLAVGDTNFRAKCFNRLAEFREKGVGFILVSHNDGQIKEHTTKAIYLEKGTPVFFGPTNRALDLYANKNSRASSNEFLENFAKGDLRFESVHFVQNGIEVEQIKSADPLTLVFRLEGSAEIDEELFFSMALRSGEMQILKWEQGFFLHANSKIIRVSFASFPWNRGDVEIYVNLSKKSNREIIAWAREATIPLRIDADFPSLLKMEPLLEVE